MATRTRASIAGTIKKASTVDGKLQIWLDIDQELPVPWNDMCHYWFRTKGPYTESNPSQLVLWLWYGERPGHWPVGEYQVWASREPDLEIILDSVQVERLLELSLDPTLPDKTVYVCGPSGEGAGCGWPKGSLIENVLAGTEASANVVWKHAALTSNVDIAERVAEKRRSAHSIYRGVPEKVGLHYPGGDPSGEPEVTIWLHRGLMPGAEFQRYSWRREVTAQHYPRPALILEVWGGPVAR